MYFGLILFIVLFFAFALLSDYLRYKRMVKKFNSLYPNISREKMPLIYSKDYEMLLVYMFGIKKNGKSECQQMLEYFNDMEEFNNEF